MTRIVRYTNQPTNTEMFRIENQVGKPLRYMATSCLMLAIGGAVLARQAVMIYECAVSIPNDLYFAAGVGLFVTGVVSLIYTAILTNRAALPYSETEVEEILPEVEDGARHIPIYESGSPDLLRMYDRGKTVAGIMFPTKIIALVAQLKEWPVRGFWIDAERWNGTGYDAWTTDSYNRNTTALVEAGILIRRGNRYSLTDNGRRFFDITASPTQ